MRRAGISRVTFFIACTSLVSCGAEKANTTAESTELTAAAKGSLSSTEAAAMEEALAGLGPDDRAQVEQMRAALAQSAAEEVDRLNDHRQRVVQLGAFVSRHIEAAEQGRQRVAGLIDNLKRQKELFANRSASKTSVAGSGSADIRRWSLEVAKALATIEASDAAIELAANRDPLVEQALKRSRAGGAEKRPVGEIVATLLDQPCLTMGPGPAPANPVALRGVSPGMTEAQVLQAACASSGGTVEVVRRHQADEHFNRLPDGSLPPTRRYLSEMTLCFDCMGEGRAGARRYDHRTSDDLIVSFLPNGLSSTIRRARTFEEVAGSSGGRQKQPRKLATMLPAMEKQLGRPSFIYDHGIATQVAWIFPDGKTPLPQEYWYFQPVDPFSGYPQLTSAKQSNSASHISRSELQKLDPRASYCANRHFSAFGTAKNSFRGLFDYAIYQQRLDNIRAGGGDSVEQRRDPKYEAAGLTNNCGTIVYAVFGKSEDGRLTANSRNSAFLKQSDPRIMDTNANIYWIDMTLTDTAAIAAHKSKEKAAAREALAARTKVIESKAAAPEEDFVP